METIHDRMMKNPDFDCDYLEAQIAAVNLTKDVASRAPITERILRYLLRFPMLVEVYPQFMLDAREKCRELQQNLNELVIEDTLTFEYASELNELCTQLMTMTESLADFDLDEPQDDVEKVRHAPAVPIIQSPVDEKGEKDDEVELIARTAGRAGFDIRRLRQPELRPPPTLGTMEEDDAERVQHEPDQDMFPIEDNGGYDMEAIERGFLENRARRIEAERALGDLLDR